jgi:hypothetical protein
MIAAAMAAIAAIAALLVLKPMRRHLMASMAAK